MQGGWNEFAGNLAFVGLAMALWSHLSIWFSRQWSGHAQHAFGIATGITAIGSILLAAESSPGILIDIRHAPLALAGMFGGPIAAAIAIAMVSAARIWVGGAGMTDGVVMIFMVGAVGVAFNLALRARQPRLSDVVILSATLAIVLAASLALLPALAAANTLERGGAPLLALNVAATLMGGVILFMTRRTQLERNVLEAAFAQSPDFLYIKDRESRFLSVNNNMAALFHLTGPHDLVGQSDFDVMPLPHAEERFDAEQDMMRSGKPIIDSVEHMGDRVLLAAKVPVRDDEGRVIGLAGVTRDITERMALETELRDSKDTLAHALAGMSDGFAMFDRQGHLVFCNEQYRLAFPLSGEARLPGAHIADILRRVVETGERAESPGHPVDDWINRAAATLHQNKDEQIELSNGSWLSIRTRLGENGTAMVVVCDITSTKHAEAALRLAAQQLKSLADTDGLTGVMNRRAFDEIFAREAARSARDSQPLSLLMIDIDWFKAYNDTYGHPMGDQCLRQVSACLTDCVKRPADVVARYGGEEFVVLLPETDADGARLIAEHFSDRLQALNIRHAASDYGRVTASVGVATGMGRFLRNDFERLLTIADNALYDAKSAGRNRVASGDFEAQGGGKLAG